MGEMRNAYIILVGKPEGRNDCGYELIWFRTGTSGGLL
jgi:hypothetical protein